MDRKRKIMSLLATLAITLACVPALPAVALLPTQPVGAVDTMVAGTSAAAAKSTARASSPTPRPNDTLVPTRTPEITPTPTATVIFKIPTFIISAAGGEENGSGGSGGGSSGPPPELACRVLNVTPVPGTHIKPDKNFNVIWRVSNRGSSAWDMNSVDYRYFLGARLHTQPIYDLPYSVPPGNQIGLVVPMHSPAKPGVYSAIWAMNLGSAVFCRLEMKIIVP